MSQVRHPPTTKLLGLLVSTRSIILLLWDKNVYCLGARNCYGNVEVLIYLSKILMYKPAEPSALQIVAVAFSDARAQIQSINYQLFYNYYLFVHASADYSKVRLAKNSCYCGIYIYIFFYFFLFYWFFIYCPHVLTPRSGRQVRESGTQAPS